MQKRSGYRDVGVRGAVNSHIVEARGCANLLYHGRKLRTVGAIAEEHNLPSFALVSQLQALGGTQLGWQRGSMRKGGTFCPGSLSSFSKLKSLTRDAAAIDATSRPSSMRMVPACMRNPANPSTP